MDARIELALNTLKVCCPHLAGMIAVIDLRLDDRIRTACVCPSGRILLSPALIGKLQIPEIAFVIGHELYHYYYRIFERMTDDCDHYLINVAHDCIVNDMLLKVFRENGLSDACPDGLLHWEDFKNIVEKTIPGSWKPVNEYSLEKLTALLAKISDKLPPSPFGCRRKKRKSPAGNSLKDAFSKIADELGFPAAGEEAEDEPEWETTDDAIPEIFSEEMEREFFPDEPRSHVFNRWNELWRAVENSKREEAVLDDFIRQTKRSEELVRKYSPCKGKEAGKEKQKHHALENSSYDTPWEEVIQTWIDHSLPPVRSWAKASRRMPVQDGIFLPGRLRVTDQKHSVNIILDTSGSMAGGFSILLGMIGSFCAAGGIAEVRLLQCDTRVTSDVTIAPEELRDYEIKGYGGSDMSPAMAKLAMDESIHSVLILTDGVIDFLPESLVPYHVLWGIFPVADENGNLYPPQSYFNPGYGTIIPIKLPEEI